MLEPIERAGDRGRRAELGGEDDEVLGGGGAARELAEHAGERLVRVHPPGPVRCDVARASERILALLEPELADVARDRRLRNPAAGARKRVPQLELRSDPLASDEAADQPLAVPLPELSLELHTG